MHHWRFARRWHTLRQGLGLAGCGKSGDRHRTLRHCIGPPSAAESGVMTSNAARQRGGIAQLRNRDVESFSLRDKCAALQ